MENDISALFNGFNSSDVKEDDGSPLFTKENISTLAITPKGAVITMIEGGPLGIHVPVGIKTRREAFEVAVEAVLSYHSCCRKLQKQFRLHLNNEPEIFRSMSEEEYNRGVTEALERSTKRRVSSAFIEIYKIVNGIMHVTNFIRHKATLRANDLVQMASVLKQMELMFDKSQILWPTSIGALPSDLMMEFENIVLAVFNTHGTAQFGEEESVIRYNWRPSIQALGVKMLNMAKAMRIAEEGNMPCQCELCQASRAADEIKEVAKKLGIVSKRLYEALDMILGDDSIDDTDHVPEV